MNEPLRVLLVEDSPTDAKLVIGELRRTGRPVEFERVETADAMRAALAGKEWDVVISDWSMPKFSAPAALGVLQETQLDLPFIIVSGTVGEDTAVEAMRAGAHDYVLKDHLGRLAPAVERELRERAERAGRRAAERALRESQARFQRLSDAGIIGIAIVDVGGNVLEANDAYLKTFGWTREDVIAGAVQWGAFVAPEEQEVVAASIRHLVASGFAPPWEMRAVRRDQSRVPVLCGAAMLDYPKSIAFVLDQTELKRAEEEKVVFSVAAKQEQAGRERAERALRASEEQLRHAQKMEAVGRLAGGVAHDFNNVLSVILSYGELILDDLKPSDPLRADIEEIRTAASRAAGLTRQLLMFSRQQVVEPKVIDLDDVILSMDKMLQRILGEDVDLVSVTAKEIGRIKVDPTHIEQVILNLVVNARDAMPTGGKLTIETVNVELDEDYTFGHIGAKPGPHVMLAVSDTGVGMDRETQARIFEPFYTTKEKGKGTGLGLSTVFGIVQQSGGNIWVYSELGKGTTFKIYLPRVDDDLDLPRVNAAPTTLRGTEMILLVEDEEQVRSIVLSILRRNGYRVLVAQHAGEALLLCEQHPETIDLLLTDVVMPLMSGPELAKRIALTRPGMKVVCMSGYTDDGIVRHGVLDTGIAFIQKPITPAALARKLRDVLDSSTVPVEPSLSTRPKP